jgi:hypothetical protein
MSTEPRHGTFGDRLTLIRVALGSLRKPLSYRELARLIFEKTGHEISHETLRIYDLGERRILLDDAKAIAAVDPERRGLAWLAFGADGDGWGPQGDT